MEKLVFVFRHKPGATRAAFHEHYIGHHAQLGLRVQQGLSGYTVNHLTSAADFDTVTEIWTPSAQRFAGGGQEPNAEIVADHIAFMGPQDSYRVEERVLREGPAFGAPTGEPGALCKVVTFYRAGEAVPEPPAEALRVVDNVVLAPIYLQDRPVPEGAAPADGVALIRTMWFEAAPAELAPGSVAVREYRYRTPECATSASGA